MLAEALLLSGVGQYSVVSTYDGVVTISLPWSTLVELRRLAKSQQAKLYGYEIAA
jgi:hypothetical protein